MIKQYSQEWYEIRKNHIGASDSYIILGRSPWRTRDELLYEKCGLIPPQKENTYMRRGKEMEDEALSVFEREQKLALMIPKVYFHKKISYLFASIDGVDMEEKVFVEIKCPGKADHASALKGKVPDKYLPQLQHQMEVVGTEKAYYFSYTKDSSATIIVERDEDFIKILLEEEAKFWEELQALKTKKM